MPIRPYLDGQKFDGETIRQMGIAFEMALASLRPTPDWNDPIRAALAQRIIALAKAGERDAELLCDGALLAVSPAVSSWRPRSAAQPPKANRREAIMAPTSLPAYLRVARRNPEKSPGGPGLRTVNEGRCATMTSKSGGVGPLADSGSRKC
jgi:hypothetical protein